MTVTAADRLPPGARVAVIAGGGRLPAEVAAALAAGGHRPFVVRVAGEADQDFSGHDGADLSIEAFLHLKPLLRRHGVSHVVLAGSISRRPRLGAVRWTPDIVPFGLTIARALIAGDNQLLSAFVKLLERFGFTVIGVHQLVPDLLVPDQVLTRRGPDDRERQAAALGFKATTALGALDVGQAAIVIGRRVVALEGVEGTAAMIARVRDLKASGRIDPAAGGVLVKSCKPGQEERADLPTIGPETVASAIEAGLTGIAVEAGRALMVEAAATVARAEANGLFIAGIKP